MLKKAIKGFRNPKKAVSHVKGIVDRKRSIQWSKGEWVEVNSFLEGVNSELWNETVEYSNFLEETLHSEFKDIDTSDFNDSVGGGGGAAYELLYFFTRLKNPDVVIETGVAAGWSSRAILDAISENNNGYLYSNDLPYPDRDIDYDEPRIGRNEVGILVDDRLEDYWDLSLGDDRDNLPKIVDNVDKVDMFHYDSDKSYSGRGFGMAQIRPKLHSESVVIMDDIDDNLFFKDFVQNHDIEYQVVYDGKRPVGIIFGEY